MPRGTRADDQDGDLGHRSLPGSDHAQEKGRYDRDRYPDRHLIENAFYRLKDFRRVATRYDKLAANFLSAVALPALLAFWP